MNRITSSIAGALIGLILPIQLTFADGGTAPVPLSELTGEWWQWALSIPTDQNPQSDPTGQFCMIGQRGPLWFLAGTFNGDVTTGTCSVSEDKTLFFPVANAININSPNVCGSPSENKLVKDLRASIKSTIDGASGLSVQVDGISINKIIQRVQSRVFAVPLPEKIFLTCHVSCWLRKRPSRGILSSSR